MEEMRSPQKILIIRSEFSEPREDLGIDETVILKQILKKWSGML